MSLIKYAILSIFLVCPKLGAEGTEQVKHSYRKRQTAKDTKKRKLIEPCIGRVKLLMNSGNHLAAIALIKDPILLCMSRAGAHTIDYGLLYEILLLEEECYKMAYQNSKPTLRLQAAAKREKYLRTVKEGSDLKFCTENNIYLKLIDALLDQCDPLHDMGSKAAEKSLELIEKYIVILENEAPKVLKLQKSILNSKKQKAVYFIDYTKYTEASKLCKLGLSIAAARLVYDIKPNSPIYEPVKKLMSSITERYSRL